MFVRREIERWRARWRASWRVMTFYQRFEQVVALLLTFLISIVIVLALFDLTREIATLLASGGLARPLEHRAFQSLFGQIMTLLIALEFKHSILKVVARQESIIQVKTVLLIAMLALARKFIILDADTMQAETILALAATILALSVSYWLLRERDDRLTVRPARAGDDRAAPPGVGGLDESARRRAAVA